MTEIIKGNNGNLIVVDGKPYAVIISVVGTTDSFERIEDGAWKWHRHTDVPVDNILLDFCLSFNLTFCVFNKVSGCPIPFGKEHPLFLFSG